MQDLAVSLYSKPSLLKWACIILFALSDILRKTSIGRFHFKGLKPEKCQKIIKNSTNEPNYNESNALWRCENVRVMKSHHYMTHSVLELYCSTFHVTHWPGAGIRLEVIFTPILQQQVSMRLWAQHTGSKSI